jgi:hypothetical protein
MPLLNYTTTIDESKTVQEIQKLLAGAGAVAMRTEFDKTGAITAVSFEIPTSYGMQNYSLPANVDGVLGVMEKQKKEGKTRRAVSRAQATRAAWRIVKDWLEAQLALVESNQVTVDQIMMPHLMVRPGVSLYSMMVEQRLQLPEG